MRTSTLSLALCATLLLAPLAGAQSIDDRPRRAGEVASAVGHNLQSQASQPVATVPPGLDALVARDGLVLCIEIRSEGLRAMAQAGALAPLIRLFTGDQSNRNTAERAFLSANLGALASSRVALAAYRNGSTIGLIQAANEAQSRQLSSGLQPFLKKDVTASSVGNVVRVSGPGSSNQTALQSSALASDPEFANAYQRFASDSFFGYLDLGSQLNLAPPDAASAAYTAGFMAGVAAMPRAVAFGGGVEGDTFLLRAMTLASSNTGGGVLASLVTSLFNASGSGPLVAAGFAPADSEVFIDLTIDWVKLYETIGSFAAMIVAASPGGQSGTDRVDPLATLETMLGFSIKNDLLPTLGHEVALSFSGAANFFNRTPASTRRAAGTRTGAARASNGPGFLLLVSLKDPAIFEKLFARLIQGPGGLSKTQFLKTPYRNATILHNKSFAYAVTEGFLVAGGSVSDIRKVLDSRVAGSTLASRAEYRSVLPDDGQASLQAYVSPSVTGKLFEALSKDMGLRPEGNPQAGAVSQLTSGIGFRMLRESEQTMLEFRMPSKLAYSFIAAVGAIKPSQVPGPLPGLGIPDGVGPGVGNGRKTPTLTTEDVRRRQ